MNHHHTEGSVKYVVNANTVNIFRNLQMRHMHTYFVHEFSRVNHFHNLKINGYLK